MLTRLKVAILRSGRKQYDVARRARIHETRFSRLVTGRLTPSEAELDRIGRTLGLSVDQVSGNTDDIA